MVGVVNGHVDVETMNVIEAVMDIPGEAAVMDVSGLV